MGMKSLVLGYLALTHVLLYASSPYYRHEVSRALTAGRKACSRTAAAYDGRGSNHTAATAAAALPRSGVYASTDLLHVIQAHMSLEGGKADNSSNSSATAVYSSGEDSLIAYMSASDILLGESWKARAALFVFMMAPRYILTTRSRFAMELDLFHLARGDLPAVGLFNRSEDPTAGYQLSCASPALSMGLGPQPFAQCTVWLADTPAGATPEQRLRSTERAIAAAKAARSAAAAAEQANATNAASTAAAEGEEQQAAGVVDSDGDAAFRLHPSSTTSSRDSAAAGEEGMCDLRQQVATWIILPDSTAQEVAQQLEEIGADPQPYLAGNQFQAETSGGWMSSFLDVWLFFPRAPLLQLLPSMTSGMLMLQYGNAVLAISYMDLMSLARFTRQLQNQAVNGGQLLGQNTWAYIMMGVSIMLQVLLMTLQRAGLTAFAAYVAVGCLGVLLRGIDFIAVGLQAPMLQVSAAMRNPKGAAKSAAAFLLTLLAALRMRDIAVMLLLSFICVVLLGALFSYLADVRFWEEDDAALLSTSTGFVVFMLSLAFYFEHWGPALTLLPAAAANSRSFLVRWAARATAAAAAAAAAAPASGAASVSAAAAAVSAAVPLTAAVAGLLTASSRNPLALLIDAAAMLFGVMSPQDALMLGAALSLSRVLEPLGDKLWRSSVDLAVEVGVVLEVIGSCLALLAAGGSWRLVWRQFWNLLQQQMQQHQAMGGRNAHGGAQLVIHAQQAAFADVGNTADVLRALADELENLDGQVGALHQQQMFMNGRLLLPRQNRAPKLGTHWPAPLDIPFDIDDVRDELGIEVPRGFICPLTLDIMRQPALLISSNIAVPSSYDKEPISRWLEDNRRDPKSRRNLASDAQLVPNFDLYRSIEDWVAHTQTLHQRHRRQQQQHEEEEAAAGPSNRAVRTSPRPSAAAAAAAAAPVSQAARFAAMVGLDGGQGAPARPRGRRGRRQQQQQSSSGIGSILAAARGAVVRGTAAAAMAAAAASGGAGRGGRRRRATAAAAGDGVGRQRVGPAAAAAAGYDALGSDLEDEGEEGDGGPQDGAHHQQQQQQQHRVQRYDRIWAPGTRDVPTSSSEGHDDEEDGSLSDSEGNSQSEDAEDVDAVHSQPTPAAAAAAAAAAAGGGGTVRQESPGASGRYNLRQRRSPGL